MGLYVNERIGYLNYYVLKQVGIEYKLQLMYLELNIDMNYDDDYNIHCFLT
jgi:hypothetical protein